LRFPSENGQVFAENRGPAMGLWQLSNL